MSTSARLSADRHTSTSLVRAVSGISRCEKDVKNGSTSSITKMSSLTTMQVAFSSVNCGLKEKPHAVKNSTLRSRSFTGRLTKIFRDMVCLFSALLRAFRAPLGDAPRDRPPPPAAGWKALHRLDGARRQNSSQPGKILRGIFGSPSEARRKPAEAAARTAHGGRLPVVASPR
ncbi:hypothetical protein IHE61_08720 [Streptomyces sp. GKU 257-1]|nr:hypothetical protein [Streptomyces sp. GKU 257-1]